MKRTSLLCLIFCLIYPLFSYAQNYCPEAELLRTAAFNFAERYYSTNSFLIEGNFDKTWVIFIQYMRANSEEDALSQGNSWLKTGSINFQYIDGDDCHYNLNGYDLIVAGTN